MTEQLLLLKLDQQSKAAPREGLHRSYFVGHSGKTTPGVATNRREEHPAIALRAYRGSGFSLPDGTIFFPVDYQLPLKSHRDEANVGLGKMAKPFSPRLETSTQLLSNLAN